eukprot:scaffold235938_cov19-Prasinocladus_malaysianus.AAC.1
MEAVWMIACQYPPPHAAHLMNCLKYLKKARQGVNRYSYAALTSEGLFLHWATKSLSSPSRALCRTSQCCPKHDFDTAFSSGNIARRPICSSRAKAGPVSSYKH